MLLDRFFVGDGFIWEKRLVALKEEVCL